MRHLKIGAIVSALLVCAGLLGGGFSAESAPTGKRGRGQASSPVAFYQSALGRQFLRNHPTPAARAILSWLGEDVSDLPVTSPELTRQPAQTTAPTRDPGTVSGSCSTSAGTKFNREPAVNALPQNEQAVDFLLNRVGSGVDLVVGGSNDYGRIPYSFTGYYVNTDADCAAELEGGSPVLDDPLAPGTDLFGSGDPVIAANPGRGTFFMADFHLNETTTAVGVFRSTASLLLDTADCPVGTHSEAEAATCWPLNQVLFEKPRVTMNDFVDKPHLAVDERTSGTGAQQVYVAAVDFDSTGSEIILSACNSPLSSCSDPIVVSGTDTDTQFPHVAVRPNGAISVSWINFPTESIEIKYRSCTVAAVPTAPTCGATSLVRNETRPLLDGALGAQDFRILTYPKHDHRTDSDGVETYMVWDRCKVDLIDGYFCPDADVFMKASNNNGATWSSMKSVNAGAEDQFFPWIRTDRARNIVNIAYYNSAADPTFQHRVRISLSHIVPGSATPDPVDDTHAVTTLLNEPTADMLYGFVVPQFGDYIGVAARGTGTDGGSRAYVHFTYNNRQGTYNGISVPNQNNHLARLNY